MKKNSVLHIITKNVFTLFNLVNLILALMIISVGSYKNLLFVFVAIFNTLISIVNELRAKKIVDQMRLLSEQNPTVLRDGRSYQIRPEQVVKGDILVLSLGDQILYDSIVKEGSIERFDCLDWVSWVNRSVGADLPIYLVGVSMGAATVLMASDLCLPENVHGIIADCGYTSPHAIWKHVANNNLHIAYGVRGVIASEILRHKIQVGSNDFSTTEALKNTRIPVLLIHGTGDHFVPVEMTYENYLACGGPRRLLIVPGADHGMSYFTDPERYTAAVLAFWKDFDSWEGRNQA